MDYQCLSSKTSIWFINVYSLFLLFMFFQIFDSALCCPKLRADLKAWVVPHVPPLSCIELCCIQISLMMLDAVPLVILWLRLVMVGSLRRMHYDILRYIRALYDKIWNAKRQNHRAKVHNLQVLPPNKKNASLRKRFLDQIRGESDQVPRLSSFWRSAHLCSKCPECWQSRESNLFGVC